MGRVAREFRFTQKEIVGLCATALLGGLFFSWRRWGGDVLDINAGIENFIIYSIATLLALFIHFGAQRIYAIHKGYHTSYQPNWYALGISLFFIVLTDGFFFLLLPGWLIFEVREIQRIGKWRLRPYMREYGYCVNWGIFANLLTATLVLIIPNPITGALFFANAGVAIFSLIPSPYNGGFHIFFASVFQYTFMSVFTLTYIALLFVISWWMAGIFAFILGAFGLYTAFRNT